MQFRNPVFNAFGTIDVEANHSAFGWIPMTVAPSDPETADIYADALAAGPAAYVAPPPPDPSTARAGMALTRRQVIIGMILEGLITQAEGVAMSATGTPPAAIEAMLSAMPEPDQTVARVTLGSFAIAYRLDPMVGLFQSAGGLTDEQMDAFFTGYAAF